MLMGLEPSYSQFNFLLNLGDRLADAVVAGFQECSLYDRDEKGLPAVAGTLSLKRGIISRLSLSRKAPHAEIKKPKAVENC